MKLYDLLKQNAPSVFNDWVKKKIYRLEKRLAKLRQDWQTASGEKEKEEIEEEGKRIRAEIKELKEIYGNK